MTDTKDPVNRVHRRGLLIGTTACAVIAMAGTVHPAEPIVDYPVVDDEPMFEPVIDEPRQRFTTEIVDRQWTDTITLRRHAILDDGGNGPEIGEINCNGGFVQVYISEQFSLGDDDYDRIERLESIVRTAVVDALNAHADVI